MKGKKILAVGLSTALFLGTTSLPVLAEELTQNAESGIQVLAETNADITIGSVDEFKAFATNVANGNEYAGKTVKLTADIDFSNESAIAPIGSAENNSDIKSFKGTFDGNGKTISNLKIGGQYNKSGSTYYGNGLFSRLENATVKNVNFDKVTVYGINENTFNGNVYAVVAGYSNKTTYENVNVKGSTVTGYAKVGGIVGMGHGNTFDSCSVTDTTLNGLHYKGGFIGYADITSEECNIEGSSYIENVTFGDIDVEGDETRTHGKLTFDTEDYKQAERDYFLWNYNNDGKIYSYVEEADFASYCISNGDVKRTATDGKEYWAQTIPCDAAASVNGKKYADLNAALTAATSTDTIALSSNITVTDEVIQKGNNIEGGVNLDLNGYTLTIDVSNRNEQTVWFDNNWNITGDADKKSKIDFIVNDQVDTDATFFAIGYGTNKVYNVKMNNLQLVLPSTMKEVYCGLIGVFDGGTLEMSNVDISSDNQKVAGALFYGEDIGEENSVILKDVKVRDIKLEKITSVIKNIDIDNLDFEAEVTEYLFSGAGSVKNSKVKYTNTDFSKSEFLTRAHEGKLTFVNTSFENVPANFSKGQAVLLDGGQLYMDEKSAAVFGAEALKNITPVKGSYKDVNGKIVDGTKATVSEIGAGGSINVTLDDLYANDGIDNTEDAKYQVVVTNCNTEDQAAVDKLVKDNADKDVLAYDIKVTKTVGDTTTTVDGIKQQKVTLTLSDPVPASEQNNVKIFHIYKDTNGDVKTDEIIPVTFVNDTTITFTAPSFSTYAIVRNKVSVSESEITTNVKAELVVNPDNPAEYNIVISAKDADKKINRLSVVDLTFELKQGTKGVVAYDVQAAGNMRLVKNGNDRYAFHFNGTNAADFTGKNVVIGKVVFSGYCQGAEFGVKDLNTTTATVEDTNVVQAAEVNDSIVKTYKGTNFDISDAKIDDLTLVEETKDLTVNVTFPNSIENQKADYQKMTVTIVSSDDSYEFNLGGAADTDANVIKPDSNGNYQIVQPVVKNRSYTVTVSGDGYRTARYTVNMTDNKVVNFWNNVKDTPDFVENGMDTSKEQVTFLAGELVKDGQINIYDLSAVVSYFGTNNLVADHPDYAKYDLDRNGKIDSRDIAFVLVSWGK